MCKVKSRCSVSPAETGFAGAGKRVGSGVIGGWIKWGWRSAMLWNLIPGSTSWLKAPHLEPQEEMN